jgi:hypothetical protein
MCEQKLKQNKTKLRAVHFLWAHSPISMAALVRTAHDVVFCRIFWIMICPNSL